MTCRQTTQEMRRNVFSGGLKAAGEDGYLDICRRLS